MTQGHAKWIDDRWPVSRVVRAIFVEDIPGGGSYWYSFGSSALFVFILQAVTGICELFFYVPTVDHAYISLGFLRTEVPFGWLIHNLHYWGATAMVVLVLIHMTRVYLWGAYKSPRQLTWLLGAGLFLLTLGMMFTGSPLPWDEKGYWATEVGTSIAGTMPLVGDFAKRLLRGGETMGQLTLSRFFVFHVALLAGLLATFILVHLVAFRRGGGSVGPWSESKKARTGPFWPDQVRKDLVTAGLVFVALVALAAFVPPAFTGAADPMDALFTPKPEWPFLSLYQALKLFPGSLEVIGTVAVPLAFVLLMLAVPFIDRRRERNPARRPVALGLYAAVLAAAVILSLIGSASKPGTGAPQAPAAGAVPAAAEGAAAAGAAGEGPALYARLGCSACHSINGSGGKIGPDLAGERTKNRSPDWLKEQIRAPRAHDPAASMPAFDKLTPPEADALAAYLLSLTPEGGPAAEPSGISSAPPIGEARPAASPRPADRETLAPQLIGDPRHGGLLFAQNCQSCHGARGRGGVANPGSDDGTVPPLNPIDPELVDPDPDVFASKIDPFPQHGSTPAGPKPALAMPAFGDSGALTQQQISNLEAYVLGLNGVRRDKIMRAGVSPGLFLILVAAAFAASGLGLGGVRIWLKRRDKVRR